MKLAFFHNCSIFSSSSQVAFIVTRTATAPRPDWPFPDERQMRQIPPPYQILNSQRDSLALAATSASWKFVHKTKRAASTVTESLFFCSAPSLIISSHARQRDVFFRGRRECNYFATNGAWCVSCLLYFNPVDVICH